MKKKKIHGNRKCGCEHPYREHITRLSYKEIIINKCRGIRCRCKEFIAKKND